MKITEYSDVLNINIKLTYYHNQSNRWCATFERAETKINATSGILTSEHGNGKTPKEAIENYINSIKGKLLVIGAYTENRREYKVPDNLEY